MSAKGNDIVTIQVLTHEWKLDIGRFTVIPIPLSFLNRFRLHRPDISFIQRRAIRERISRVS